MPFSSVAGWLVSPLNFLFPVTAEPCTCSPASSSSKDTTGWMISRGSKWGFSFEFLSRFPVELHRRSETLPKGRSLSNQQPGSSDAPGWRTRTRQNPLLLPPEGSIASQNCVFKWVDAFTGSSALRHELQCRISERESCDYFVQQRRRRRFDESPRRFKGRRRKRWENFQPENRRKR